MLNPRTNDGDVVSRPLSPEQWERLRQHVWRRAHDDRARVLRNLFGHLLFPVRRLVAGGWDLARLLAAHGAATASRWGRAYATWRTRRQAIRELGGLDDRALKDFGLNRSEIESVVYGRHAEPEPEGKIAALLFHKPYDRPSQRQSACRKPAPKQLIEKSAA